MDKSGSLSCVLLPRTAIQCDWLQTRGHGPRILAIGAHTACSFTLQTLAAKRICKLMARSRPGLGLHVQATHGQAEHVQGLTCRFLHETDRLHCSCEENAGALPCSMHSLI